MLTLGPEQGPPTSACPPRPAPPDQDLGVCPPQHVYLEWLPSESQPRYVDSSDQARGGEGRERGGTRQRREESVGGREEERWIGGRERD